MRRLFLGWKSSFLLLAVFLVGFFVNLYVYKEFKRYQTVKQQTNFTDQIQNFTLSIQERYVRDSLLLNGIRGLFEASEYVGLEEWTKYMQSLNLQKQVPGIQFVSYMQNIPQAGKEAFLQLVHAKLSPDYKIWPAGERSSYFPIVYVYPNEYSSWIGFDYGDDPNQRQAAEKAALVDTSVVGPEFVLTKSQSKQSNLVLVLSVYRAGARSSVSLDSVQGWVLAFIDLSVIIDDIASSLKMTDINIQVFKGKEAIDSEHVLTRLSAPDSKPLFTSEKMINIGNQDWLLFFSSGPGFKAEVKAYSPTVTFLFMSLALLAILIWIYKFLKEQEFLGTRAGEELIQALLLSEEVLDSVGRPIIASNGQGKIQIFNKAAEKLLGYTACEIVGKQTAIIFHDPQEIQERATELSNLLGKTILPDLSVFKALVDKGVPDEATWIYVRKDGVKLPVAVCITGLRDKSGALIGFVEIAREKE